MLGKEGRMGKKLQKCVWRGQHEALFYHANKKYIWWLLSWHTVEAGTSLTLLPALRMVFLLLSCLVQEEYEGFYPVLLYLALSCLAVISSGTVQCWRGNRGSGSRGQENGVWVGEVEGGETMVWLYYMIEESLHYLVFSLLFIFLFLNFLFTLFT